MNVFGMQEFDAHERVVFGCDEASGLRAIVALHSTVRGPAAGGCRMWAYASPDEAVADVLRLSRGMSYKNAMASLPFGGGKAVIIGDSRSMKSTQLLQAFGRLVDSLNGRYITAEDVGTTIADMGEVAQVTQYVSGLGRHPGEAGGDPAPKTALGVLLGIKTAVCFQLGRDDLQGLRVAVQGVGGVGYHLCRLLAAEGADLLVADVQPAATERAIDEFKARAVSPQSVLFEAVDVLAPCALGAVFDDRTTPRIRARIIAGAANNQLAQDRHGTALHSAGVLYAPDYVINAGGIISVAREYRGGSSEAQVTAEIRGICGRLQEIFERARAQDRGTNQVADEMARERIGRAAATI
ncbi:MAG TPA: Glu/Leu/Phe/Val dehydrogenase dimerization domain-containing protein [Steroidobacteraceae bacterium]